MNALERPELCHILMNALEEAVKLVPGYKAWEKHVKAFNTATAVRHNKEVLLNGSFKNAPPYVRKLIHSSSTRFIDSKWAYFEEALFNSCLIRDHFWEYYNDDDFDTEPAFAKSLRECRDFEEFGPMCEAFYVVAHAVGLEMSWCEGCDCHAAWHMDPNISYRKKREMLGTEGSCAWMGKRPTHFALGHCSRMLQNVSDSTTTRWQELLLREPPRIAGK